MRFSVYLLLLSTLTHPVTAQTAAMSPLQLTWTAPPECPAREAAAESLHQLLADTSPADEPSAIRVDLTHGAQGYAAEIEFSGGLSGRRVLEGQDCTAVADAAILVLAIAIDPNAVARYVAETRDEVATAPREGQLGFHFGVRLGGDLGSLPQASLGPAVLVGLSYDQLRVDLELGWWLPRVARRNAATGSGGEIGLIDGLLRGCYELVGGRQLDLAPCAGISIGRSSGEGMYLRSTRSDSGVSLAVWAGVRVRQRSGRLFIELGADAGLSLAHPVYQIDDVTLFGSQHANWLGRASLALGWLLN